MRKLVKLSFALMMILSAGIIIQSCKSSKETTKNGVSGESIPDISGSWILKSLNGQPAADIFKGKIPTMNINASENRISGQGGCNGYSGTYTYVKGILSAPNLASTMMMCVFENQESQLHAVLGQSNKVSLTNGILTLSNEGKVIAEFEKGVDTSLLEGQWILESIAEGDMKTLFPDQIPTVSFDLTENRLGGDAGCNRYNAAYKIEGTVITVGPAISTRMACPHMEGESKFTQTITGESELEVTADKMSFLKNGKAVLTFTKSKK